MMETPNKLTIDESMQKAAEEFQKQIEDDLLSLFTPAEKATTNTGSSWSDAPSAKSVIDDILEMKEHLEKETGCDYRFEAQPKSIHGLSIQANSFNSWVIHDFCYWLIKQFRFPKTKKKRIRKKWKGNPQNYRPDDNVYIFQNNVFCHPAMGPKIRRVLE